MLKTIMLGVSLGATLGPVSIEMIKRGLAKGFWSAFVVRLGGVIGNFLCLCLCVYGLSHVFERSPGLMAVLGLFGGVVLMTMGYSTIRRNPPNIQQVLDGHESKEVVTYTLFSGLFTGFIFAVLNPVGLMYWVGIFSTNELAIAHPMSGATTNTQWLMLLSNLWILVGVLLWGGLLSGVLQVGKKWINDRTMRMISKSASCFLLYYGFKSGYQAAIKLLSMWSIV